MLEFALGQIDNCKILFLKISQKVVIKGIVNANGVKLANFKGAGRDKENLSVNFGGVGSAATKVAANVVIVALAKHLLQCADFFLVLTGGNG